MARCDELDLSRAFTGQRPADRPCRRRGDAGRSCAGWASTRPEDELNCGACGYDTCREHAVAILQGPGRERDVPALHHRAAAQDACDELADRNEQLASTQEALMQSEKLASMGQLAAGIAHEVNNPLGVVLMYAHLLLEECAPATRRMREDLADDRRAGRPLQEDRRRAAALRPAEQGAAAAGRRRASWWSSACGRCPPPDGVAVELLEPN